jgi:DNA mismatch repair ATPase MutL
LLIDQHAIVERVECVRLRDRHAGGAGELRVAVQNMLFPVTLDTTPSQLALVARVGDLLSQVGFASRSSRSARRPSPSRRSGRHLPRRPGAARSLLHEWAEMGAPSEAERLDALLGEIVCDSVVRAGDRLMPSEAETLLHSLDGVALSLPAPHGGAALLSLPLTEIDRRFGRWRGRSPCVGFHRSVHDCKVERALREPRTAS